MFAEPMGLIVQELEADSGLQLGNAYVSVGDNVVTIAPRASPTANVKTWDVYTTFAIWKEQTGRAAGKPPITSQALNFTANGAQVGSIYRAVYDQLRDRYGECTDA